MYHQIILEFESENVPDFSKIYEIVANHFKIELKWRVLYAAGIRGEVNPCDNWDIESVDGYVDQNSIHNFDTTDSAEIHEAQFVAFTGEPNLPSAPWKQKIFFDNCVFSVRMVERGILLIYSADKSIYENFRQLDLCDSFKVLASDDCKTWQEVRGED